MSVKEMLTNHENTQNQDINILTQQIVASDIAIGHDSPEVIENTLETDQQINTPFGAQFIRKIRLGDSGRRNVVSSGHSAFDNEEDRA